MRDPDRQGYRYGSNPRHRLDTGSPRSFTSYFIVAFFILVLSIIVYGA